MFPRKRRGIFDLFGDDMFRDIEDEFARMDEMFKMSINEAMKRKPGEGGPFVYGFSMRTGPDGKPIINEFGNVLSENEEGSGVQLSEDEREPLVDVIEGDKEVTVIAELPGIEKKDIKLDITENEMLINVDNGKRKYNKVLELLCEVKSESAKASYKNGVLEVKIEKVKKKEKKKGVNVKVE